MLGEHLREGQLMAIFTVIEREFETWGESVSYDEASRILRYMNPNSHLGHLPKKGTIAQDEAKAYAVQNAQRAGVVVDAEELIVEENIAQRLRGAYVAGRASIDAFSRKVAAVASRVDGASLRGDGALAQAAYVAKTRMKRDKIYFS